MTARRIRRIAVIGFAALTPLLGVGIASADNPPPTHVGDPALWGPAAERLCEDPDLARQAGYNVIEDPNGNNGGTFSGTLAADALYGYGGNDTIFGSAGDDVICGGSGNDKIKGEQGSDAAFGEGHNDTLKGDKARDYLDGGGQTDDCDGGAAADAEDNCETVTSVP